MKNRLFFVFILISMGACKNVTSSQQPIPNKVEKVVEINEVEIPIDSTLTRLETATIKQLLANTTKACDPSFEKFFKRFASDSVFQRCRIQIPFENKYYDDPYESVEVITEYLYEKNLPNYIDFRSHKKGMQQEYDQHYPDRKCEDQKVIYTVRGYDNGIFVEFEFRKLGDKWYWISILDLST